MDPMPDSWTARHFSQANPEGEDEGDVPALLRRVADTLQQFGDVKVLDLILQQEPTERGFAPAITVYFDFPEND